MNERIKELAIKAGLIAPYGSDLEGLREFDYRMFAELIVRECAEWMDAEQDEKGDGISDNFYWSARMRKHFGVEE